jgi:hypothetical protein
MKEDISLGDAKKLLQASLRQGTKCPCCGHLAKAYKRRLYSTQISALRRIYEHLEAPGGPNSVHLGEFLSQFGDVSSRGGEVARLQFWDLLKKLGKGRYAMTDLGRDFLAGKKSVPAYLYFYNQEVISTAEDIPRVYVKEVESNGTKSSK